MQYENGIQAIKISAHPEINIKDVSIGDGKFKSAQFKGYADITIDGQKYSDNQKDVIEIGWSSDGFKTQLNPMNKITTWHAEKSEDGQTLISLLARHPGGYDVDEDGVPDTILIESSDYPFVPRSSSHPDGIDRSGEKLAMPVKRIKVVHSTAGQRT